MTLDISSFAPDGDPFPSKSFVSELSHRGDLRYENLSLDSAIIYVS